LTSRKSLQTGGPLLAADAIHIKHKRLQKERLEAIKKAQKALDSQLRKAKNEYHKARVAARRTNRERRKQAEEYQRQWLEQPLPEHLLPVRDPSKEPTQAELDALLPNPSLQQAILEAEGSNRGYSN
jgi:hypothetical protein